MSSRITKPTVASQQKVLPKKRYIGKGHSKLQTQLPPKFSWAVNEQSGYFQLGAPFDEDDFYIFNTTLVSCEYFHLLEDTRRLANKQQEGTFWTIQYRAFGIDIISDPFQLSLERNSRHTFIGDKITARIRSNGVLFHDYLKCTSLEFRVFRSVGVNGAQKLAGISFVDLKKLTLADIKGLKACLDIVPQGDFGTISDYGPNKPQLSVVIEMSVIPNFFPAYKNTSAEIPVSLGTGTQSKPRHDELEIDDDNHTDENQNRDDESEIEHAEERQNRDDEIEVIDLEDDVESEDDSREEILNQLNTKERETGTEAADRGNSSAILVPHGSTNTGRSSEFAEEGCTRALEAGDSLDGMTVSRHKPSEAHDPDDRAVGNKLSPKLANNFANWTNDEIIKFREELKEKEQAYMQVLQEEWTKRDEGRELKAIQVIQEQAVLKQKLEAKETQLAEMESGLRQREREVEEFANKATLGLSQRVEEMKLRMNFTKEKYQNDLDLAAVKLQSAHTEMERLNGKIQLLETKLRAKEDEVDQLNAMRTQWPDISLERKLVRLEEKNAALLEELTKIRRERDSYRNGALSLAKRQNQLQSQRDTQLCNENDALRAQILIDQQRRDIRKERESTATLAKNLEAMTKAYLKETKTHDANLTEKIDKRSARVRSPLIGSGRPKVNPQSVLNSAQLAGMTADEIDAEISRLVFERDKMIGTGGVLRTDTSIQNIDNVLIRLTSDLMARGHIAGY